MEKVSLINKSGRRIDLTFHKGEQSVRGLIDCMASVYGIPSNYANSFMFDVEVIREKIRQGKLVPFAAITDDGIPAATLSYKKHHGMRGGEIGALVVNPEFRGFNLGQIITEHVLSECKKKDVSLLYAHMVMYHAQSGRAYEKLGFIPTGFLFGAVDSKKHLAQLNLASQKISWAVYVKNDGSNGGTVYVPSHLKGFVREIYTSLGADVQFADESGKLNETSHIEYKQDDYHKTLNIDIIASGRDLRERLEMLEKEYTDELQTSMVLLNISEPGAVYGYEVMRAAGYRFFGLNPLAGERETIIMSKINRVLIDSAEFQLTVPAQRLFERVSEV
ncbi:MAG: GNAT family N-acetyltransferase [Oscillospiraceae bacterium]|nr:GNAT family N-acetyltransferase [Oscillospiraceae bacterium]